MNNDIQGLSGIIHQTLSELSIPSHWLDFTTMLTLVVIVIISSIIFQKVAHKVCRLILVKAETQLHSAFFKYVLQYHFLHYLILLVNFGVIENIVPFVFVGYAKFIFVIQHILAIAMVYVSIKAILSCFYSVAALLRENENYRDIPFDGYLQVIKIILFSIGILLIFSILTNRSLLSVMTALGAISAILMLLFKDTIMGFVGSVQITINNLVRLGDWITVTQYGADGIVQEISLTTVKIMNYDNTLTTVPTYALASGSFQNWRSMEESGNRRFTRVITVISRDIRFLEESELEKFTRVGGLDSYIKTVSAQYQQRNTALAVDQTVPINLHRITNCDLFMEYARWYLKNHPLINADNLLLVRHLATTTEGVQIQIYAFTRTTALVDYESILAEVMGHLLASVSFFGLNIYETTAASDSLDVNLRSYTTENKAQ